MKPLSAERSEKHLERCCRQFKESDNPLYVFEGWAVWRGLNRQRDFNQDEALPIPGWIAEYLDACGLRLLGSEPEMISAGNVRKSAPWQDQGQSVSRAMGFSGELGPARARWGGNFDSKEVLAMRVVKYMDTNKVSLDAAARAFEDAGWASWRTARRAVEDAHNYALRHMQVRLEEAGWPEPENAVHKRFSRLCQGFEPD